MVMRNCHEDTIRKTTFTSNDRHWSRTMQTGYENQIAMWFVIWLIVYEEFLWWLQFMYDLCLICMMLICYLADCVWDKVSYLTFFIVINLQKSVPTWTTGPTQPGRTPSGLGEREWERGLKMYLGRWKKSGEGIATCIDHTSKDVKHNFGKKNMWGE